MDNTLWVIEQSAANIEELKECALFQRNMLKFLMSTYSITYSQILFPYADERNLFTASELGEKPIFGTHAIVSGMEKEWLEAAASGKAKIRRIKRSRSALESALRASPFGGVMLCGSFSELPADCADWQIRDAARKFASFADIVETKTKGGAAGILGGRLVLCCDDDFKSKANELYIQKTGGKAKARIIK